MHLQMSWMFKTELSELYVIPFDTKGAEAF